MNISRLTLLSCCWLATYVLTCRTVSATDKDDHDAGKFTNEWAVRVPGGETHAELIAREHGYQNIRKMMGFDDIYLMRKSDMNVREKREAIHHTRKLNDDFRVDWAEQQEVKRRDKRGYLERTDQKLNEMTHVDKEKATNFNDPLWVNQWYLHRSHTCDDSVIHLNVAGAWAMGYSGRNVVVCIVDDGLEWNHTDIKDNYEPLASFDINDHDNDPFPRYDLMGTNRHGSRCAGEVAMVANNSKCGVGVAYEAKIGGVRLLDGPVTDSKESEAIGYNCQHVDIYSSSWGPTDNGEMVDGPGRLTTAMLEKCIREGRNGLGVIYVWASGNGGMKGDHCGCDGYINSIYSIAINSISEGGTMPWYGEKCAATMACTNSGGSYKDHRISTIDLHNECTNTHSGTSAAAPLAAAAFALVLQANPGLTWRDCQHILVCSAETYQIWNNQGWLRNGVNIYYNDMFGFGVMNVHSMTHAAIEWVNVGPQVNCTLKHTPFQLRRIVSGHPLTLEFDGSECTGNGSDKVNHLEHVQIVVTMNYSRRGALEMELISPMQTRSSILNARVGDKSVTGFRGWAFTSVHFWGESPKGIWRLIVADKTSEANQGIIINVELILRGTSEMPPYRQNGVKCGVSKQAEEANLPCTPKMVAQPKPQPNLLQQFINLVFSGKRTSMNNYQFD